MQNVLLPSTHSSDYLSSGSVTLCAVVRFTCFHLHKVPGGLPSYILRTGPGRTDGRDVYGVIECVPLIVVFDVGTQLPTRSVMTLRPNARAGEGCYLFPSKLVCGKVGLLCPVNPYGESVRLTGAPLFEVFVPNTLCLLYNLFFHLELHIVGVKTISVYLSTAGKPCLCYSTSFWPGISGFSM